MRVRVAYLYLYVLCLIMSGARTPPIERRYGEEMRRRQEEIDGAAREMLDRYPVNVPARWHGGYPPANGGAEQREIPELDANPHSGLGDFSAAPPPIAGLHIRAEQPPTSNLNVLINFPRVVPPEAPSNDATTAQLQSYIIKL